MFGAMTLVSIVAWTVAGVFGDSGLPRGCKWADSPASGGSSCDIMGICGGSSTSTTVAGVPLTSGTGTMNCCFSEKIIPDHETLVRGEQMVVGVSYETGSRVFRTCSSPIYILGFAFGSWTCPIDQIVVEGKYPNYDLIDCPDDQGDPGHPPRG